MFCSIPEKIKHFLRSFICIAFILFCFLFSFFHFTYPCIQCFILFYIIWLWPLIKRHIMKNGLFVLSFLLLPLLTSLSLVWNSLLSCLKPLSRCHIALALQTFDPSQSVSQMRSPGLFYPFWHLNFHCFALCDMIEWCHMNLQWDKMYLNVKQAKCRRVCQMSLCTKLVQCKYQALLVWQ